LLELLRIRLHFGESERGKKTYGHASLDMRSSPHTRAGSGPVGHWSSPMGYEEADVEVRDNTGLPRQLHLCG